MANMSPAALAAFHSTPGTAYYRRVIEIDTPSLSWWQLQASRSVSHLHIRRSSCRTLNTSPPQP